MENICSCFKQESTANQRPCFSLKDRPTRIEEGNIKQKYVNILTIQDSMILSTSSINGDMDDQMVVRGKKDKNFYLCSKDC